MTEMSRRRKLEDTGTFRHWLAISLILGAVMGVAWFVLAPGGAIYGDGTDYDTWFPRDAALALLMVVAGLISTILMLRSGRKAKRTSKTRKSQERRALSWSSTAATVAVLVGGFAGSLLAWRVGVFAGDLFHTLPENLANPSIVFSLRSPSVLLVWPLVTSAILFVVHFVGYYFMQPAAQSVSR